MRDKGCIYNVGVKCDGKGDCRICGWCTDESLKAQAEEALEEAQKEFKKRVNPYWERISEMAKKQRAKGIDTYGQGLEDNPMTIMERLEYLQEELIDGLMYIEHIKAWLMEVKK